MLKTPSDNKILKQDKGQNKKYLQNLQKFVAPKGITRQKLLKLMKAITPKESSLKGILNQSTPYLHAILYASQKNQLNATHYCKLKEIENYVF